MKKKNVNALLASIFFVVLFVSCSGGATYWIDNPTDQAIAVSIDSKEPVSIEAGEFKKMDGTLSEGEHTMKVGDGQEIKFTLDKNHIVLNPTLSTYVMVLQEYGVGLASSNNDTIVVIDNVEYEGPFPLVSNEPFIFTGDVNFLVDSPFKDEITTSKSGTVTMKKIFRKNDFIDYFKKEYN